jgi:3-hydroxyisobutyrate dehydrogenase-like beta-hydroxyacid dehydrogenase
MAAQSRRAWRNFPPVATSCCRALRAMKLFFNVYGGADGVFANARHGALVIDLSTVNPKTSQELSRLGSARGVHVLDVTMSGSTPVAEQGALTLFGGGDQGCFAAAESIFRVIARKYFYLGPSGSGATMKLVVNSLLGIGMQALPRPLHWVRRLGSIAPVCWAFFQKPRWSLLHT